MLRSMNFKSLSVAVSTLILTTSVNAVVLNTLNGVDYQWLELTATTGLSRNTVELRLADVNDELYGYEYASRQQVADLLLSYTPWDGNSGFHGNPAIFTGYVSFLTDFGITNNFSGNGIDSALTTVDGYDVLFDGYISNNGLAGLTGECGIGGSCQVATQLYSNAGGTQTMALQDAAVGYDASGTIVYFSDLSSSSIYGSYLVQVSAVPIPHAVWLFGSGLLGLVGVARRKKS